MALKHKPHQIVVSRAVAVVVGGRVVGHERMEVASFNGMVGSRSAVPAEAEFGVRCRSPHVLLADVSDAGGLKIGDHVLVGDDRFVLRTGVVVFNADVATSHAKVLMEKLD